MRSGGRERDGSWEPALRSEPSSTWARQPGASASVCTVALSHGQSSFRPSLVEAEYRSQRSSQGSPRHRRLTLSTSGWSGVLYPGSTCSCLEGISDRKPNCLSRLPAGESSVCLKLPCGRGPAGPGRPWCERQFNKSDLESHHCFSDPFLLITYLVMSWGSCGPRRGAGSPPITLQSPKSQGPASPGAVCPPQPQPLWGLRRPQDFSQLISELTKAPSPHSLFASDDNVSESPGSLHSGPFKHHRNTAVLKTRTLSGIQ